VTIDTLHQFINMCGRTVAVVTNKHLLCILHYLICKRLILFKIPKWPKKTATKKAKDDLNVEREAFQTGLSIAKLLTSYWNSQQNPGKAYLFNRRVHHGEIGSLLGLSNLFKKRQPIPTGILSGLGEGLAKDDYRDRKEWFTFKKKDASSESSKTVSPNSSETSKKENC
jgi:hypothetical protein